MHKTWKQTQLRFLTITLSVLLSACGYTGPNSDENGNGGPTPPPTGGTPPPTPPPTTSPTPPPTTSPVDVSPNGVFKASAEWYTVNESGAPDTNKLPVKITLNEPLAQDSVIKLTLNNGSIPTGIFSGATFPQEGIAAKAGQKELNFQVQIFEDSDPEADQENPFTLLVEFGSVKERWYSTGGVKIIDNDNMRGNLPLLADGSVDFTKDFETAKRGDFKIWDLNGEAKPFSNERFTVTQTKGYPVAWKITNDKLRLQFPAPTDPEIYPQTKTEVQQEPGHYYEFEVTANNQAPYKIGYMLYDFNPVVWVDIGEPGFEFENVISGVTHTGTYENFYLDDPKDLSITIYLKAPQYELINIDNSRWSFTPTSDGGFQLKRTEQSLNDLRDYMKKDESVINTSLSLTFRNTQTGTESGTIELKHRFRHPQRTATVSFEGLTDEAIASGSLRVAIRNSDHEYNGLNGAWVYTLNSREIHLPKLTPGEWEVFVNDLNGRYDAVDWLHIEGEQKHHTQTISIRDSMPSTATN